MDHFSHAHDTYFGNLVGLTAEAECSVTAHRYVAEWQPSVEVDPTFRSEKDKSERKRLITDIWYF